MKRLCPDLQVETDGTSHPSLYFLRPITLAGRLWVNAHIPADAQWWTGRWWSSIGSSWTSFAVLERTISRLSEGGTMGTRSLTIVMDGNQELCWIYRQYDGYPDGHGCDLAKLCNVKIVNGFSLKNGKPPKRTANGMGCLAGQIIKGLKDGIGNVYLEPTGGEINDWCEYVYVVRGHEGCNVVIECTTQTGPWPFNVQASAKHIFTGTAKAWLEKFSKASSAA